MNRAIVYLALVLMASVFLPVASIADDMKKVENLIYSIHAYDGNIYRATFAREASDTIFLLANMDNFLSTRKTFIYYFPAFDGYRVDAEIVNYQYPGTLEVRGNGIMKTIAPVVYTYTNIPEERATDQTSGISAGADRVGSESEVLHVYTGDAAVRLWERYEAMLDEHRRAMEEWEDTAREFAAWQKAMVQKIRDARDAGKDVSGLVSEVQNQHSPYPPQRPNYTINPLLEAFIINLPKGEYDIVLKDPDGYTVEASEKRLVVFEKKRDLGICYQFASADKITKPGVSPESDSVIYTDGSADLYLGGYYQDEYNEYYHNRLETNDAKGSVIRTKAVIADKVTDAWLEVTTAGRRPHILLEELYYIQPDNSQNTGYSVVIWDGRPNQPMQYLNPSFSGFHLPVSRIGDSVALELRSLSGEVYDGSKREVRIVRNTPFLAVLYILSFLPLVAFVRMIVRRRKLFSRV